MTSNITKLKWLEKGYEDFGNYGPENLSINKISKEIGSSRASFYHHFGDLEGFTEELLEYYWNDFERFSDEGVVSCKKLFPDVYAHLANNQLPLKFSRQLFLNRQIPNFGYIFSKIFHIISLRFILKLFVEEYNLKLSDENSYPLWLTVSESWFSRLDPNDLSEATLIYTAKDILKSVDIFTSSKLYNKIKNN